MYRPDSIAPLQTDPDVNYYSTPSRMDWDYIADNPWTYFLVPPGMYPDIKTLRRSFREAMKRRDIHTVKVINAMFAYVIMAAAPSETRVAL